jgi:hypothetical protein
VIRGLKPSTYPNVAAYNQAHQNGEPVRQGSLESFVTNQSINQSVNGCNNQPTNQPTGGL